MTNVFNPTTMTNAPTIAIIGGGVAGLSVAWQALKMGCQVTVFERGSVCNGATNAAAGMLATGVETEPGEENLLLIRITENDFRAFDNACPHQGVRNKWSYEDNTFTCSQHGNSFSNECGGGLKCYETTFKDNILTVTR